MAGFEIMDHTADAGIIAWGDTIEEVFINAARGMFSLITDSDAVSRTTRREIRLEAPDREELLVAWLNELLYLLDTDKIIFGDFRIDTISDSSLVATALGERLDLSRHAIKTQVKAATYHMLKIAATDGRLRAQVILDI